jgi:hypothetical protein
MAELEPILDLARRLSVRLERLSVDSIWARRASGLRGGLLKAIEEVEQGAPGSAERLMPLIRRGFEIVEAAAHEIPE